MISQARFPGGPWANAIALVVAGCGAVLVAGAGPRGAVLHAVGWPMLAVLAVLLLPLVRSGAPVTGRRPLPFAVGYLGFYAGVFPLVLALLFGPQSGLLGTAAGAAFVGLWMVLVTEPVLRRLDRRRRVRR